MADHEYNNEQEQKDQSPASPTTEEGRNGSQEPGRPRPQTPSLIGEAETQLAEIIKSQGSELDLKAIVNKVKEELAKSDKQPVKLEIFHKLYEIPLIGSSIDLTLSIYNRVRTSNCLSYRVLKTAEKTAVVIRHKTEPIVNLVRTPLTKIDYVLCASLDIVEDKVPCIMLPPGQMVRNTAGFIKDVCTGRCAFNCVKGTCKFTKKQLVNCKDLMLCRNYANTKDEKYQLLEIDVGREMKALKDGVEKKYKHRKRVADPRVDNSAPHSNGNSS